MTESDGIVSEYEAEKYAIGSVIGCAGLFGVVAVILVLFTDDVISAIALYFLITLQGRIARKAIALANRTQELYGERG